MEVALLEIRKKGDNKDFNGGFGTRYNAGSSILSKALTFARSRFENFPGSPMSYAYISAIFKQYGHSVKYYVNEIPELFDILLIHVSLIRHNEEISFINKLKSLGKKNIGVYGPLATVRPELFQDADFIIEGEPEEAITKICKTNAIPSERVKSKTIMDLDALPFPDWSIFPLKKYSFSPIMAIKPFVFVLASRGCPYKCSYCQYLVFGTYRTRKPEKVIEELIYLKDCYGIKAFYFRDPTFSINQKRIEKIANLMISNRLDFKWGCETRLDLLTIPLLQLLHKSGMRAIKVGIESLNHSLLKKLGRIPPNMAHQEKIISFCKKIGIQVIAFYMIGLPSDRKESIEEMIKYSRKLNTSYANFTICTPIHGTDFYEKIENKIFDFNLNHYDNFHPIFKHDYLTKKEILDIQGKAITGYYIRPRYFLRYIIDRIRSK